MPLRLTRFEFERLLARRRGQPTLRTQRAGTRWEEDFAAQLVEARIVGWEREYRFREDRRFRFDFAFPGPMLAVEIDGAVHRIKKRYRADQEKGTLALLGGWRVFHTTPAGVRDGTALEICKQLLVG